jgi:hypothetical protein
MKGDEMAGAYSTCGEDDKCVHNFGSREHGNQHSGRGEVLPQAT